MSIVVFFSCSVLGFTILYFLIVKVLTATKLLTLERSVAPAPQSDVFVGLPKYVENQLGLASLVIGLDSQAHTAFPIYLTIGDRIQADNDTPLELLAGRSITRAVSNYAAF